MIWEFECLEVQYPSISIFGNSFVKIYFLYIYICIYMYICIYIHVLFSTGHISREPYSYSGWRRFLFRWCITENFSLKGSQFFGSYIRVYCSELCISVAKL